MPDIHVFLEGPDARFVRMSAARNTSRNWWQWKSPAEVEHAEVDYYILVAETVSTRPHTTMQRGLIEQLYSTLSE